VLAAKIGVILAGDIPFYEAIHQSMLAELAEIMPGEKHEIIFQNPIPDPMSLTNSARKLNTLGVNIMVTYGLPATLTSMKVITDTPIVFAGVYNPESLSLEGKNATGISSTVDISELVTKLHELSGFKNLGVIFNKSEKDSIMMVQEVKKLEASLGFKTILVNVTTSIDEKMLANADALLLTSCSAGNAVIKELVNIARRNKAPSGSATGCGVQDGIILSLSAPSDEQGKATAGIIKQVLAGSAPSSIPLRKPSTTEFIINQKEAQAMGLTIPRSMLDSATTIIK
jgi:putative ABC transport system substrate-binding protein